MTTLTKSTSDTDPAQGNMRRDIGVVGLLFAEVGAMFPLTGGEIRFPHLSFGSFASYTMGWINWIAAATVAPIEVEGALQYATKYAAFTKEHTVSGGDTVHTLTG